MLLVLLREPLVYLQHFNPFGCQSCTGPTYLHSFLMCSTAHASYIQYAGLEISYLQ